MVPNSYMENLRPLLPKGLNIAEGTNAGNDAVYVTSDNPKQVRALLNLQKQLVDEGGAPRDLRVLRNRGSEDIGFRLGTKYLSEPNSPVPNPGKVLELFSRPGVDLYAPPPKVENKIWELVAKNGQEANGKAPNPQELAAAVRTMQTAGIGGATEAGPGGSTVSRQNPGTAPVGGPSRYT